MKKDTKQNEAQSAFNDLIITPEDEKENAERLDTMQTRGKKGLKLERFNAAFSPDNMDYIKVAAALNGQTMTNFLNDIVTKDREAHAEAYQAAKEISEKFKF